MKRTAIGIGVGVLAIAAGLYVWQSQPSTDVPASADAQRSAPLPLPPAAAAAPLKDTSMLKPPAGAKVAVYEFDDLECPACANALPMVHAAVARYKIPLVHHDFPLTEIHVWSLDAAVTARYLQDHVSDTVADQYRRDVFAHQRQIETKDDLDRFTSAWFQQNGQQIPFVMDANGACRNEVLADRALAQKIGIPGTPCIFVVTETKYTQVQNVNDLGRTIEMAIAETRS